MTNYELPEKALDIGDYFDVVRGTPNIDRRWLKFSPGGNPVDLFFYGLCPCGHGVYGDKDLNSYANTGRHSIVPLVLHGEPRPICYECSVNEAAAVSAAAIIAERPEDFRLVPWPHIMEAVAARG